MIEDITEEKTIENNYMQLLQQDCEVFTNEVMEYPPSTISLGEKTSKTGKTFFLSLLAGVYLSGQNIYGGNLKGHRDGRCLIHFDTEMGLWHTQKVAQRIENMAGDIDLGCYKKYALRKLGHRDMLKFIEYTLKENEGNNGLILIDGVADLVTEVNYI